MKLREIGIGVLLVIAGFTANALGNGAIKGKVLDPNGAPAIGTNVFTYVGSSMRGAVTNMDGYFTIRPLPAGTYNIMITNSMFDTIKIAGIKVKGDGMVFLKNQQMAYRSLGVVTITRYREPLINKMEPSAIDVLPATFTRSATKTSLTSMISNQSSEIFQADEGEPMYFRGARAGSVVYLIDGVKSFSAYDGFPSSSIGSMRIYTGGVPAQYGDLLGGIVVIETKSYLDMYKH